MNMYLKTGFIPVESLKVGQTLVLTHGGAGPQDPQGQKFVQAQQDLGQCLIEASVPESKCASPHFLDFKSLRDHSPHIQVALRTVAWMENHPTFNAGRGASLQADGQARVSASYMDSDNLKFSAVMNAEGVLNPSQLAYYLQSRRYCILDAQGAGRLARELGVPPVDLVTDERLRRWMEHRESQSAGRTGTVGAVACGPTGRLVAVTSTGGVGNETVGRVGDSPTIAGNYCNRFAAISCTGIGEQIIAQAISPAIAVRVQDGMSLAQAVEKGLQEAAERGQQLALIALARSSDQKTFHWAAGAVSCTLLWGRLEGESVWVGEQCLKV